jgi:hypothetical protein
MTLRARRRALRRNGNLNVIAKQAVDPVGWLESSAMIEKLLLQAAAGRQERQTTSEL